MKKKRFSADRLQFNEITQAASGATKSLLTSKEGVHPFARGNQTEELDSVRLAPEGLTPDAAWDKHCYGLFVPNGDAPEVAVYVKLLHIEPDAAGNIPSDRLPGNINEMLTQAGKACDKAPNTAIFYTITNAAFDADGTLDKDHPTVVTRDAQGRAGGEVLINRVAAHLAKEYGIKAFSTLSPVRVGKGADANGFAQWLEKRLKPNDTGNLLASEERDGLRDLAIARGLIEEGTTKRIDYFSALEGLIGQRSQLEQPQQDFLQTLMTNLGAYYVAHEKAKPSRERQTFFNRVRGEVGYPTDDPDAALNKVTGFHSGNGAELANVHWLWPDQATPSDMKGSFGLMVNYRYYPEELGERKGDLTKSGGVIRMSQHLADRYHNRMEALGEPVIEGWQADGAASLSWASRAEHQTGTSAPAR